MSLQKIKAVTSDVKCYWLHFIRFIDRNHIRDVPGGKVNILGGHTIGHSKQKC